MINATNNGLSASEMRQIGKNTTKLGMLLARWWAFKDVHIRYDMNDVPEKGTLLDEQRNLHSLRITFQWSEPVADDEDVDDADDACEVTLDAATLHREEERESYDAVCAWLSYVEERHSAAAEAQKAKDLKAQLESILSAENIELLRRHNIKLDVTTGIPVNLK